MQQVHLCRAVYDVIVGGEVFRCSGGLRLFRRSTSDPMDSYDDDDDATVFMTIILR